MGGFFYHHLLIAIVFYSEADKKLLLLPGLSHCFVKHIFMLVRLLKVPVFHTIMRLKQAAGKSFFAPITKPKNALS
jgi:hypothetical protein